MESNWLGFIEKKTGLFNIWNYDNYKKLKKLEDEGQKIDRRKMDRGRNCDTMKKDVIFKVISELDISYPDEFKVKIKSAKLTVNDRTTKDDIINFITKSKIFTKTATKGFNDTVQIDIEGLKKVLYIISTVKKDSVKTFM